MKYLKLASLTLIRIKYRINYAYGWFGFVSSVLIIGDIIQRRLSLMQINVKLAWLLLLGSLTLYIAGYLAEKWGIIREETQENKKFWYKNKVKN